MGRSHSTDVYPISAIASSIASGSVVSWLRMVQRFSPTSTTGGEPLGLRPLRAQVDRAAVPSWGPSAGHLAENFGAGFPRAISTMRAIDS